MHARDWLHFSPPENILFCCLAPGLLTGKHARPTSGGEGGSSVLPGRFRENPNYLPRFYTAANFEALALIEAGLPTGVRGLTVNLVNAESGHEHALPPPVVRAQLSFYGDFPRQASFGGVSTAAPCFHKVGLVEASYAWLLRHSALGPADGLLLGASSPAQLGDNLAALGAPAAAGGAAASGGGAAEPLVLPPATLAAFDAAWEVWGAAATASTSRTLSCVRECFGTFATTALAPVLPQYLNVLNGLCQVVRSAGVAERDAAGVPPASAAAPRATVAAAASAAPRGEASVGGFAYWRRCATSRCLTLTLHRDKVPSCQATLG